MFESDWHMSTVLNVELHIPAFCLIRDFHQISIQSLMILYGLDTPVHYWVICKEPHRWRHPLIDVIDVQQKQCRSKHWSLGGPLTIPVLFLTLFHSLRLPLFFHVEILLSSLLFYPLYHNSLFCGAVCCVQLCQKPCYSQLLLTVFHTIVVPWNHVGCQWWSCLQLGV